MRGPLLALAALLSLSACKRQPEARLPREPRILVVCYSWSGNTRAAAGFIREALGADYFEIEPATPYPENYQDCVSQAREELASGYLPALKGPAPDLGQYDLVFLGSPNWWSTIAPPVRAFATNNAAALKGRTVVPFFTHGGGGLARCQEDLKALLPGCLLRLPGCWPGKGVREKEEAIRSWARSQAAAD